MSDPLFYGKNPFIAINTNAVLLAMANALDLPEDWLFKNTVVLPIRGWSFW